MPRRGLLVTLEILVSLDLMVSLDPQAHLAPVENAGKMAVKANQDVMARMD
jgi:hypothetical protein